MPKYLSGRVKRVSQSALSTDRYSYLGLNEAEPNLGDPTLVYPSLPIGLQYQLVSIPGYPGERYWIPVGGGLIPGSISVFDEGSLVGTSNSITQLNFVGNSVAAQAIPLGIAATITVAPPGNNGSVLFKESGDFATSSGLLFNSSVGILTVGNGLIVGAGGTLFNANTNGLIGIGTTNPTQKLDIQGDLRLTGTIYDYNNQPGTNTQILIKNNFGGLTWVNQETVRAGAGGTYQNIQFHNSAGLVDGASNFVFDDINSRIGIGSTQPKVLLDVLGISSFKGRTFIDNLNVSGIATIATLGVSGTTTTRNLLVTGITTIGFVTGTNAYFTGIVTATKFKGAVDITDLYVTGLSTFLQKVNINNDLGVTGLTTTQNFQVYQATTLNRLNVSGISTFDSQVNINNLNVTGVGTFDNIKFDTNTISTLSGNLILNSSAGIIEVNDAIYVTDTTQSTSRDTGSIITEGGVGIEKDLYVGGTIFGTVNGQIIGYASSISISTDSTNTIRYVPFVDVTSGLSTVRSDNLFVWNPSSNSLGIGTTNPTSALTVVGNAIITNPNAAALSIRSGAAGSYASFNIGRTSIETTFSVAGSAGQFANDSVAGDLVIRTESTSAKLLFTNGATNSTLAVAGNNVLVGAISSTGTASQPLQVSGGGYFNGRIGIGTTNPQGSIHIYRQDTSSFGEVHTDFILENPGKGNARFFLKTRDNNRNWEFFADDDDGSFGIYDGIAVARRFSILPSGNVLIGTSSTTGTGTTSQRLQVTGGAYVSDSVGIGTTNPVGQLQVSSGPVIIGAATSTGTASQRLQVTGGAYVSGNTGIGTTNPTSTLTVQGNVLVSGVTTYFGNVLPGITDTYNLGSLTQRWNTIFANTFNGNIIGYASSIAVSTDTTNTARYISFVDVTSGLSTVRADDLFVWNPSSNSLGIGTTNPTVSLQLSPTASISNVGTGITLPATAGAALTVAQFLHNNNNASYLRIKATRNTTGSDWTTASTKLLQVTDVTEQSYIEFNPLGSSSGGASGLAFGGRSGEWARFNISGNLGIGTTNPGERLQVDGNLRLGVSTTSNYIAFYGTTGDQPGSYNHTYIGERIWSTGSERSELFLFKGNDADTTSGQDRIRLAGGQVRIDTYTTATGGASFESVATSANLINRVVVHSTGEVGIGTDVLTGTASQTLQVTGGAYVSTRLGIAQTNPNTALHIGPYNGNTLPHLYLASGNNLYGWRIDTQDFGGGSVPLRIWRRVNGTDTESVTILNQSGNVGVGTTTPTQSLHIQGNARITGAVYDSTNSAGTSGQVLQSTVTGTQWTTQGTLSVAYADNAGIATNLKGGIASQIPYQTAANTTAFISNGSSGQLLKSNGTSAPSWVTQGTLSVGYADNAGIATNLKGGAGGSIPYQSAANTTTFVAVGAAGSILQSDGSKPVWISQSSIAPGYASSILVSADATNTTRYIPFVDVTSGITTVRTDSNISYNPGTDTLSLTNLSVSGVSTFNGNVTLGDSTSDLVSFTSRVGTGITPSTNGTLDLGGSSNKWNNIHANTFNGTFVGIASTAKKLETARSIAITGDLSWSVNFDGSANVSSGSTLANSGVMAGTYGSSTQVGILTVDSKGRVTAASNVAINLSSVSFPSGTLMLFQQTAAPTGWTKQTTHNNKALRVVSGTASSGGTTAFTTVFASRTPAGTVSVSGSNSGGSIANATVTGSVSGSNSGGGVSNHTLSTSEMPSHQHGLSMIAPDVGGGDVVLRYSAGYTNTRLATDFTGGSGSHGHGFTNPSWSGSISLNAHSHTFTNPSWSGSASFSGASMDFAVQYVDLIIASKD
jgi:hypothetical protein